MSISLAVVSGFIMKAAKNPEQATKALNIKDMAEVILTTKNKVISSDSVKGLMSVPINASGYNDILKNIEAREQELKEIEQTYAFDGMVRPTISAKETLERDLLYKDIEFLKKQLAIVSSISKEDILPLGFESWSKIEKHLWSSIVSSAGEHTPYLVSAINYTAKEKVDPNNGTISYTNELDGGRAEFLKSLRTATKLLNTQFYSQNGENGNIPVINNVDKVGFNQKVFDAVIDAYVKGNTGKEKMQTVLKGLSVHVPMSILEKSLDAEDYNPADELIKNRIEDSRQDNINRFKSFNVVGTVLCVAQLVTLTSIKKLVDSNDSDNLLAMFVKPFNKKVIEIGGLKTIDDIRKEELHNTNKIADLKKEAALLHTKNGVLNEAEASKHLVSQPEFMKLVEKQKILFNEQRAFGDSAHSEVAAGIAKNDSFLSKGAEGLSFLVSKTGESNMFLFASLASVAFITHKIAKGILKALPKNSDKLQTQHAENKIKASTHDLGFDEKSTMVEIRKHASQHILLTALRERKVSDISLEARADIALMGLISERLLNQDFTSKSINNHTQETIKQSFEKKFPGTTASKLLEKVDELSLDKLLNLAYSGSIFRIKTELAHNLTIDEQLSLMNLSLLDKYTNKEMTGKNKRASVISSIKDKFQVSLKNGELVENTFVEGLKKYTKVSDADFKKSVFANDSNATNTDIENILKKTFDKLNEKEVRTNFGISGNLSFLDKSVAKEILDVIKSTKNYSQIETNKVGSYLKDLTKNGSIQLTQEQLKSLKNEISSDKTSLLLKVKTIATGKNDLAITDLLAHQLSEKDKVFVHSFIRLNLNSEGELSRNTITKLEKVFNEEMLKSSGLNNQKELVKNALVDLIKEEINLKTKETMKKVKAENDNGKSVLMPRDLNNVLKDFTVKSLSSLGMENASILVGGKKERPIKRYLDIDVNRKTSGFIRKTGLKITNFLAITELKTNSEVKVKVTEKDIKSLVELAEKQKDYGTVSKAMISVQDVAKRTDLLMKKINDRFLSEKNIHGYKR